MKRLMMLLLLSVFSLGTYQEAQAKLLGVEIRFEKGTKEWNADKTEVRCIGKGICIVVIKVGTGVDNNSAFGTLGFDEKGRFGMSVSAEILRNSTWSDTFVDGYVTIYKDIEIGSDIRSKLSNCPQKIAAGRYRYTNEGGELTILF